MPGFGAAAGSSSCQEHRHNLITILQSTSIDSMSAPCPSSPTESSSPSIQSRLPEGFIRLLFITSQPRPTLLGFSRPLREVICTLKTFPLSPKPDQPRRPGYTALSYCWRHPRRHGSRAITLNGRPFPVSLNLHDALKEFTVDITAPKILWIDQICINQQDVEERNEQLALMGSIYEQAAHVVAWLGRDGSASFEALKSELEKERTKLQSLPPERVEAMTEGPLEIVVNSGLRGADGFDAIHRARYMERVWTFQELVLGNNPTVQCGSVSIPLELLRTKSKGLKPSFEAEERRQLFESFRLVQHARGDRHQLPSKSSRKVTPPSRSLLSLASSVWTRKSSDPRDKIFAVLGLYQDKNCLSVDYSHTLVEVFVAAAYHMIQENDNLDILHLALLGSGRSKRELTAGRSEITITWPSWLPDWRIRPVSTQDYQLMEYFLRKQPIINEDICKPIGQRLWSRLEGSKLIVKGRVLGRWTVIDHGSSRFPESRLEPLPACCFLSKKLKPSTPGTASGLLNPNSEHQETDFGELIKALRYHDDAYCPCDSPPQSFSFGRDHSKHQFLRAEQMVNVWYCELDGARETVMLRPVDPTLARRMTAPVDSDPDRLPDPSMELAEDATGLFELVWDEYDPARHYPCQRNFCNVYLKEGRMSDLRQQALFGSFAIC